MFERQVCSPNWLCSQALEVVIYPTPRKDKELAKPKLKAAARKINCLQVAKKLHKGTILEAENKYISPKNGARKELSWLNSRVMEIIRSKITFFRK